QHSNWLLMLFGVGVPGLIVAISAGFIHTDYPDFPNHNCWVKGSGPAIWSISVPIIILVVASILMILNTFCNKETPPDLIDVNLRCRQSDSYKLRWVVLALIVLTLLVWGCGVGAFNSHDSGAHIAFALFTLALAGTILGARTWLDDTFRSKMHRLCCGTELTYKRTEMLSLSAQKRSRVSPAPTLRPESTNPSHSTNHDVRSNGYCSSIERTSITTPNPGYTLPNTPPNQNNTDEYVLIKRSYNFAEDDASA
ncbi:unnamed protein product, partial [Meganyctiphanes norvegica]